MVRESQKRASTNYNKRNPNKHKIYTYRSNARTFIRVYATSDDLKELQKLIDERRTQIEND